MLTSFSCGHATLGEERADYSGEHGDDELNDGFPAFETFHVEH